MNIGRWEKELDHRGYPKYVRRNFANNSNAVIIILDFYNNCWEVVFLKKIKNCSKYKLFINPLEAAIYADIKLIDNGDSIELPMFFTY